VGLVEEYKVETLISSNLCESFGISLHDPYDRLENENPSAAALLFWIASHNLTSP